MEGWEERARRETAGGKIWFMSQKNVPRLIGFLWNFSFCNALAFFIRSFVSECTKIYRFSYVLFSVIIKQIKLFIFFLVFHPPEMHMLVINISAVFSWLLAALKLRERGNLCSKPKSFEMKLTWNHLTTFKKFFFRYEIIVEARISIP